MLPWLLLAVVVVPLLVVVSVAARRSKARGEHPVTETDAVRQRTEQEFAEAEAYEADWRAGRQAEHDRA